MPPGGAAAGRRSEQRENGQALTAAAHATVDADGYQPPHQTGLNEKRAVRIGLPMRRLGLPRTPQ